MATEAEKEQKAAQLQTQYNRFQELVTELESQLITISSKHEEHLIVDRTLSEIPDDKCDRKCFKMIGGVLVNKTVTEVIAILKEELGQLAAEKKKLEEALVKTRKDKDDWMTANNVKIVRQ